MNFIDKLNILIGNEGKATAAPVKSCWDGMENPPVPFPGTVISRSNGGITYRFPKNDPCITSILNTVNRLPIKMCGGGVKSPCCVRRQAPGLTKCLEINTTFRIPYGGSGVVPSGQDPNQLQVPAGFPVIVKSTISVYPTGYELTAPSEKPHLADQDAMPLDQQARYIDR